MPAASRARMDRFAPRDSSSRGSPSGAIRRTVTSVPGRSPSSSSRLRNERSPSTDSMVARRPTPSSLSLTSGHVARLKTEFNFIRAHAGAVSQCAVHGTVRSLRRSVVQGVRRTDGACFVHGRGCHQPIADENSGLLRPLGGIGIRSGFKIRDLRVSRFESERGHRDSSTRVARRC